MTRYVVLCLLPTCVLCLDPFACAVKKGAFEQAEKLLKGRHTDRIAHALNFSASGCPHPNAATASYAVVNHEIVDSFVLHVALSGDDKSSGTFMSPLRTLFEAQRRLRDLPAERRAGARVELAPGTHFLDDSLVFTVADSGSAARPVIWNAKAAVVSGGRALDCKGKWRLGSEGIYECSVQSGLSFQSLFVAGNRQIRARYPNGSPYVPGDGYASGCQTRSTVQFGTAFKKNLQVIAADGRTEISLLSAFPQDRSFNVTVEDTLKPRTVDNCKQDQVQYHGTRFNESFNYPFWLSPTPSSIELPESLRTRSWKSAAGAVVKMLHPAGWGGWAFEVKSNNVSAHTFEFSRGGFQEARGNTGCGKMYVENLREELDAPGEWFLDAAANKLYFKPPSGMSEDELQTADVVYPVLQRLIQFRGSPSAPVHDIILQGFNVSHSAPTYLESYEVPSGGDWSIHRGGAIFLDGAERIALRNLVFDQVDGNAVFLSNHAINNSVEDSDFWRIGDTAIAVVGSVPLGDGRADSGAMWPVSNRFEGNWIEEVGVYMKQTSCVFRSLAEDTVIRGNVCYNGPRAGINFNDAFKGGDIVEGNVFFNMVRETGDHGTFNSWDRREYIFECNDGQGLCFTPRRIHVRHNMFLGPAGWNMDHDDGSSYYDDYSNVVYLNNFKIRDGVSRNLTGNLMVKATPVFQVTGFDTNFWVDNTLVDESFNRVCAPNSTAALSGTSYALLRSSSVHHEGSLASRDERLTDANDDCWTTHCICDDGIHAIITQDELETLIRKKISFGARRPVAAPLILTI